MPVKIVIAKPGKNALTEQDPNDLTFTSDFATLQHYLDGIIQNEWEDGGGAYTTFLEHGLGYVPYFVAYTPLSSGSSGHNQAPLNRTTIAGEEFHTVYADKTYLYFVSFVDKGTGNLGTTPFYYKIFKNNLNF